MLPFDLINIKVDYIAWVCTVLGFHYVTRLDRNLFRRTRRFQGVARSLGKSRRLWLGSCAVSSITVDGGMSRRMLLHTGMRAKAAQCVCSPSPSSEIHPAPVTRVNPPRFLRPRDKWLGLSDIGDCKPTACYGNFRRGCSHLCVKRNWAK